MVQGADGTEPPLDVTAAARSNLHLVLCSIPRSADVPCSFPKWPPSALVRHTSSCRHPMLKEGSDQAGGALYSTTAVAAAG